MKKEWKKNRVYKTTCNVTLGKQINFTIFVIKRNGISYMEILDLTHFVFSVQYVDLENPVQAHGIEGWWKVDARVNIYFLGDNGDVNTTDVALRSAAARSAASATIF